MTCLPMLPSLDLKCLGKILKQYQYKNKLDSFLEIVLVFEPAILLK